MTADELLKTGGTTADALLKAPASEPAKPPQGALGKIGQIVGEEFWKSGSRYYEDAAGILDEIRDPKPSTTLPLTLGPVAKGAAGGIMAGAGRLASRVGAQSLARGMEQPGTLHEKVGAAERAAGTALLWEAAFSAIPRAKIPGLKMPSLKEVAEGATGKREAFAERVGAFTWAGEAPLKAYEQIKDRVPPGKWMFVPTINPKAAITAKEAAEKLGKLKGLDYDAAYQEIVAELNRLDAWKVGAAELAAKGPRPYAGSAFKARTAEHRFTPKPLEPLTGAEQFAEKAVPALKDPLARTAADIAATGEDHPGLPRGMIPFLIGREKLGDVARYIRP